MTPATPLAPLLERFFTDRLLRQRQASPHTIASYRDTFRLLLKFAHARLHTPPARLSLEAVNAPLIGAFLDHLEQTRGVSVRSRNLRLTAIHSFFRYPAFETPAHAAQIQRVLAMPSKRFTRRQIAFLTRPEIDALLAAPDHRTWFGRRDHALLLVFVQTGLRLSELTALHAERCHRQHGRARSSHRERSQREMYAPRQIHHRRLEGMVARTPAWGGAGAVPDSPRNATERRRGGISGGQASDRGGQGLPLART
jgi:site-specific recombinase XerD